MDLDEERAIAQVVESLVIAFPGVPESRIRECVNRVHNTFINAKLRSFIPILVAREARAEVAVLPAADATASDFRLAHQDNDGDRVPDRSFGEAALGDMR